MAVTMNPPVGDLRDQRIRILNVDDLWADPPYQRPVQTSLVRRIARNFDLSRAGVIQVSLREDGTHAVIDGKQRLAAATLASVPKLRCLIHEGLTEKEEADLFYQINGREGHKPLSAANLFVTEVCKGDSLSVALNQALKRHGFKSVVDRNAVNAGQVGCIFMMKKLWARNPQSVKEMLALLQALGWPATARLVGGFFHLADIGVDLSSKDFQARIAKLGQEEIERAAQKYGPAGSGEANREWWGRGIRERYNSNLHEKNRI